MNDDEIIMAVNAILSEVLTEASYVAAESEDIISLAEAIQQAVFNLAHDPDGTIH
jgi:hypothetical protein